MANIISEENLVVVLTRVVDKEEDDGGDGPGVGQAGAAQKTSQPAFVVTVVVVAVPQLDMGHHCHYYHYLCYHCHHFCYHCHHFCYHCPLRLT